jgi:hypothetical protein
MSLETDGGEYKCETTHPEVTPIRMLEIEDCCPIVTLILLESARRARRDLGIVIFGIHREVERILRCAKWASA